MSETEMEGKRQKTTTDTQKWMNEKEHEKTTTAMKAFHCSRIMGISQFKFKRTPTLVQRAPPKYY